MVLQEARMMIRSFSDLDTLEKHRESFIEDYGMDVYKALRRELIKRKRKKEWKALQREKKKLQKKNQLPKVTAKSRKKCGEVLVSLPSIRRVHEEKEEERKLPFAKIIYTPMGNKR